jgi:SNF family Na+-dependent transporter
MRVLILLSLLAAAATAFTAIPMKTVTTTTSTALNLKRRDLLITGVMGLVAGAHPLVAGAKGSTFFYDQQDQPVEQSQMYTGGKLDLNAAFVVSCV